MSPANVVRLHPAPAPDEPGPDELRADETHFRWPPDHLAEVHSTSQPFDEPFWREHCDPPESIEQQCGLGCLCILLGGMTLASVGLLAAWAVATIPVWP